MEFFQEPKPRGLPVALDRPLVEREDIYNLGDCERAQHAELGDLCELFVEYGELVERIIERDEVEAVVPLGEHLTGERDTGCIAAPLLSRFSTGVVGEHMPHSASCQSEEVVPPLDVVDPSRHPEPRLVDKRCGLQRVPGLGTTKYRGGEPAQLGMNGLEQFIGSEIITAPYSLNQL